MDIRQPPAELSDDIKAYLQRQFQEVEDEINSANGVSIVKHLPDRPREGKLYYVRDEGLYFWIDDEWKKIAFENVNGILGRKWNDI